MSENTITPDVRALAGWAAELDFHLVDVVDVESLDLSEPLRAWLDRGFHGEMAWLAREPDKRAAPARLVPGTRSAVIVALDYAPAEPGWVDAAWRQLRRPGAAYVSLYARGRDYHKLVRQRLQRLADRVASELGPFGYRAFCDSAPVMEVALAERAGLGWRGKHTLLLNRQHGSMMFLGALFTDLPLGREMVQGPVSAAGAAASDGIRTDASAAPPAPGAVPAPVVAARPASAAADHAAPTASAAEPVRPVASVNGPTAAPGQPGAGHCGSCRRCLDVCPTAAIIAPYRLDARRCISYLTIELKGSIPEPLRAPIGNRIYGCDDCQLVCPWNKYARIGHGDFAPRHDLDRADLLTLFAWDESTFELHTRGSAIRRIGHERWLRNLAVAIGNLADGAARDGGPLPDGLRTAALAALHQRRQDVSALVCEHIDWAIGRLEPAR